MNNNTQHSLNSSGAHIAPSNNFSILKSIDNSISNFQSQIDDEGFWIADLARTREILQLWKENLPDIKIHYAMKCCNEPSLLE
jgi:ornithine decarboxylase